MASSSSSSPEISAAVYTHTPDRYHYPTLDEVLEDLTSRFLLNLPEDELASLERVCFQVEQAHWFYEDFIREENPKFPSLPLKKFSEMLFAECPLLHHWDHEGAFNHFMQYKTRVPVCGAIMLNDTWDKVVLVKGWKSSSGWGFPKGKINESEAPHACAAREVEEETGYNLGGQLDPEDVIEMSIREQKISLYIVSGVPEDYHFQTKTRKEISRIEWFRLVDLPTWRRGKTVSGKFYLISPFIGPLRAFINERKPRIPTRKAPRIKDLHLDQNVCVQKENGHSVVDFKSHATMAVDHNGQESSSQSSSADNGDPQTPSPLYSEPPVPSVNSGMADPSTEILDPALRRLLVALSSSSARSIANEAEDNKSKSSILQDTTAITPAPPAVPTPSTKPYPVTETDLVLDWSMRGPRRSCERLPKPTFLPSSPPSVPDLKLPPSQNSKDPKRVSKPASLKLTNDRAKSPAGSHVSSPPPSATLTVATSSSLSSSRPTTSRRGSTATADLSPYLARASEAPTIGKRMKQLALLESLADESARMTPVLGRRTPVMPGAANGVIHESVPFGTNSMSSHVPPPPTSVPSPSPFNNLSTVYNAHGHNPPQQPLFHPFPYNGPPAMTGDDPFTVRPRTSNTFRPIPNHLPRPFNTRGSMNQAQLLSVLSGFSAPGTQRLPMPPLGLHPPPPLMPAVGGPSAVPFYSGANNLNPMGPAPTAVRSVPPHFLPGSFPALGPISAPAHAPKFNIPPQGSANLLSILNSNGPSARANGGWNGAAQR
ncbi:hypothetical protein EW146_g20 [Bondarzewia mesenterica]|uniref:Nudix hydrolase domain-containing protein n=1 Tax=Bondarzewia mesenterica TaxID=1095465 RepID=A0A4S4M858_9AGAM|nr:hypothetical protein EW146_g20 [Bondarzewia mesenterica]